MALLRAHWAIGDRVADALPRHREFRLEEAVWTFRGSPVRNPLEGPDPLIDHAPDAPSGGFRDRVLNVGLFGWSSERLTGQAKPRTGMTDQASPLRAPVNRVR